MNTAVCADTGAAATKGSAPASRPTVKTAANRLFRSPIPPTPSLPSSPRSGEPVTARSTPPTPLLAGLNVHDRTDTRRAGEGGAG